MYKIGEKVKVYKNFLGTKSERFQKVERIDGNKLWVSDYKFPFMLDTGLYSQLTIDGFKIFIIPKRNLKELTDK